MLVAILFVVSYVAIGIITAMIAGKCKSNNGAVFAVYWPIVVAFLIVFAPFTVVCNEIAKANEPPEPEEEPEQRHIGFYTLYNKAAPEESDEPSDD